MADAGLRSVITPRPWASPKATSGEAAGPGAGQGARRARRGLRVTEPAPARTRLQAAAARGLTRFVGRDAELEHCARALERAARRPRPGGGRRGRAGGGQVAPLLRVHPLPPPQGWLVLESGSVSYGKATAYLPVIDLLKAYFKSRTGTTTREIREKVAGKLLDPRPRARDRCCRPSSRSSTSPSRTRRGGRSTHPSAGSARSTRSSGCCCARARSSRSCLVFEDLHWIDAETQAFLDSLVESLPTARILLLVNYRPEYQHGWGEQDVLHVRSGSTRSRPRAPRSCSRRCSATTRARSRSSAS